MAELEEMKKKAEKMSFDYWECPQCSSMLPVDLIITLAPGDVILLECPLCHYIEDL